MKDTFPLLTFHDSQYSSEMGKLPGGGSKIIKPTGLAQLQRHKKSIENIKHKFAEHISLQDSTQGLIPEKVLVLEVLGSLNSFAKQISTVEGFEFLSRSISEDPGDQSNSPIYQNGHKPLPKTIYMSMSNQSGLQKLLRIWEKVSNNEPLPTGQANLRDALLQLDNIRLWGVEDRIKDTFLLEDWEDNLDYQKENDLNEPIQFEIELWFREDPYHRQIAEKRIRDLLNKHNGNVTSTYVNKGIGYHAILGVLPVLEINKVLHSSSNDIEYMRCDDIMHFRPVGQCQSSPILFDTQSINTIDTPPNFFDQPSNNPVAALLDGLPLEQHILIKNRITIEDPYDFELGYKSPTEQIHGTAMASLIINGDLSKNNQPILPNKLYCHPILQPGNPDINGNRVESIPPDKLPLELIHLAVKRMFDGEGDIPPTAPTVKIINLSVCDRYRLFDSNISPWAKMIDWLSEKYDVLFIISGGNHTAPLNLGIDTGSFNKLSDEEKEKKLIHALNDDQRNRRIMSPGEAVNAITVNASHNDHSNKSIHPNQNEIYSTDGLPSPINPISLGVKNAIKPEIMLPGGRAVYRNRAFIDSEPVILEISNSSQFGPGQKVASPSNNHGSLNSVIYTIGTSNAAALATRRLVFLNESLESMKSFDDDGALSHAPDSITLKALLIHGAELKSEPKDLLESTLKTSDNSKTYKALQSRHIGYGLVNESRIHFCKPNQATLLRTGVLKSESSNIHTFPLPKCLASTSEFRRLIITVAWLSPINPLHHDYLESQIWVSDVKNNSRLQFSSGDYYHHHQKKGSVYHEVITGDKVSNFTEDDTISLQVNCKKRANAQPFSIPYSIVVTLDTPLNLDLPVYNQVEAGLQKLRSKVKQKNIS